MYEVLTLARKQIKFVYVKDRLIVREKKFQITKSYRFKNHSDEVLIHGGYEWILFGTKAVRVFAYWKAEKTIVF